VNRLEPLKGFQHPRSGILLGYPAGDGTRCYPSIFGAESVTEYGYSSTGLQSGKLSRPSR
jgi:hypothetical protein